MRNHYYIGSKTNESNYLIHYGVAGMKWGIRRFQNEDGSLKPAGKGRYDGEPLSSAEKRISGALRDARYGAESAAYNAGRKISKAVGLDARKEVGRTSITAHNSRSDANKAGQTAQRATEYAYSTRVSAEEDGVIDENEEEHVKRTEEDAKFDRDKARQLEQRARNAESAYLRASARYSRTPLGKLENATTRVSNAVRRTKNKLGTMLSAIKFTRSK